MGTQSINISGLYIGNICAGSTSIISPYTGSFQVGDVSVSGASTYTDGAYTKDICIKVTGVKDTSAVKCLEIHSQLSQILELKQYSLTLETKVEAS